MKNRIVLMCVLLLSSVAAYATVTGTATSASFVCSNSAGPFPFTFPIDTAAAMTVTQNGAVLSSSAYTIAPVNNSYDNGGSVTLNTACPSGQTLVLERVTPVTQLTQFTPYMPALYANIENGLDKLTEIEQEQYGLLAPLESPSLGYLSWNGTTWVYQSPSGTLPAGCAFATSLNIPCGGTGATTAAAANLAITGVTQTGTLGTSSQVSTFPGTVTAGSTISNISGPVVNLLQFAVCDGVTDDTAAIQSAFTSAGVLATANGSATLYVPDGRVCLVGHNPNGSTGFILNRPPNVNMDGKGTIKIGAGLKWQFLINTTAAEDGAWIQNVTFDGNGANNPISSSPGSVYQGIIQVYNSNNFKVDNCTFINTNGVFDVLVDAMGSTNAGVQITNNRFSNLGVGASVWFDTSVVRSNADKNLVQGNTFTANSTGIVNTAMEIDGGHSSIMGNIVNGLNIGIIYAPIALVSAVDTSISNNILNVGGFGIDIYTSASQSSAGIQGLTIANNQITINRNLALGTANQTGFEGGIIWDNSSIYPLIDGVISGNTVRWVTETAQYPVSMIMAGISITTGSSQPTRNVYVFSIIGNTIDNSPAAGIIYDPLGGTSNGVLIAHNTVNNPGQDSITGNYWKMGMLISAGVSIGPSFVVEGNVLSDNQATPTMSQGIYWIGVAGDNANKYAFSLNNTVNYKVQPSSPPWGYFNSVPTIHESIYGFGANQSTVLPGATSGNFAPAGSTIFDSSTFQTYTNTVTNGHTFVTQVPYSATGYTGTGNVVMSDSPTFTTKITTPSITATNASFSGTVAAGSTTPTTIGPNGVLLNGVPALQSQTSLDNYYSGGAGNLTGTGPYNTANGFQALYSNTTGYQNTANGLQALYSNTTGYQNTANGIQAGQYIADGSTANQTSSNSVYEGYQAYPLSSGDTNENVIGNTAIGHGSNTTTLGNSATVGTWLNGTQHITATAPTSSAGTVAAYSSNVGGAITSLSAATTVTITFANSGWTNAAFCVATPSVSLATAPYVSAISPTTVTFTFVALTGNLYYHCDGN